MQRVRIGLTGLSCVFLLVLLAAAFLGFTNEADRDMPVTENAAIADTNSIDVPNDPLAELGVAPGNPIDGADGNMSAAGAGN